MRNPEGNFRLVKMQGKKFGPSVLDTTFTPILRFRTHLFVLAIRKETKAYPNLVCTAAVCTTLKPVT